MREALDEFLIVLAYSTKTQFVVVIGMAFFVDTMVAGDYFTRHLELHGVLAPLTDVVREKIAHKYDKVAWAALISFLFLAVKSYKKDRKRLLSF